MLCNEWSTDTNGHLTIQYVIHYWGAHSATGMPGAILSFNVVAIFSSHKCVLKNKQYLGILSSIIRE